MDSNQHRDDKVKHRSMSKEIGTPHHESNHHCNPYKLCHCGIYSYHTCTGKTSPRYVEILFKIIIIIGLLANKKQNKKQTNKQKNFPKAITCTESACKKNKKQKKQKQKHNTIVEEALRVQLHFLVGAFSAN